MKGIDKKIILICLPPITVNAPYPGYSVIKSFLLDNDVTNIDIKYWNFLCNEIYRKYIQYPMAEDDSISWLLPFLWEIATEYKDTNIQKQLELFFLEQNYINATKNREESLENLLALHQEMFAALNDAIDNTDFSDVLFVGLSSKINQLVPASLIAKLIKKRFPELPIVIGGFPTQSEAVSAMQVFPSFDYAVWGEGEHPTLELSQYFSNMITNVTSIPRLIYRQKNKQLLVTSICKPSYIDLDAVFPNYDEYFNTVKEYKLAKNNIRVGIENNRGCGWDKCEFCIFSQGYKYRSKSNKQIIKEVKYVVDKYDISNFSFLGSDIGGNVPLRNFDDIVTALLEVNNSTDNELLFLFDVTPKVFNKEVLAKISLLNHKLLIGFESTADTLLTKMNKLNRFADNLLFLKLAKQLGMLQNVEGKIIEQIPEETSEDVNIATSNLKFLRFFLGTDKYEPMYGPLTVNNETRFFSKIPASERKYWDQNVVYNLLPKQLFADIDRFTLFSFMSRITLNQKRWDTYKSIADYYVHHNYYYQIFRTQQHLIYKEYCDDALIKSFVFDDLNYVYVLEELNEEILTFEQLYSKIHEKNPKVTKKALTTCLKNLYDEQLVYYSEDFRQIISVIDVDKAVCI